MQTATTTNGTPTEPTPKTKPRPFKGFADLLCPECMNTDGTVRIDLHDMVCSCSECDVDFTAAEAVSKMAERLAQWQKVARWVELAADA